MILAQGSAENFSNSTCGKIMKNITSGEVLEVIYLPLTPCCSRHSYESASHRFKAYALLLKAHKGWFKTHKPAFKMAYELD